MDEKELRLIFEQAWLPATLDAVMEQMTLPVIMAVENVIRVLHDTHQLDTGELSQRLSESALSCSDDGPRILLETMAQRCLQISQDLEPEGEFQMPSRSALRFVWTNPAM